ncbi:hypothetical protein BOTCAL_0321g00090 [Botryotinia calthae]|uniref:C2H2-type domain-containing protein n=1 Tax=Botryotinia calthae TaxID=38488 RepID=A0A4Y8CU78_9HELO|nr:hypothetical protein BOTCAL_0321g00090 [Botryotinia calthae]
MNKDNSKNHQRSILEKVPPTQLLSERYKCHEIHKLLDCLCQQLKKLEMMDKSDVLMIWKDEFSVIINILNEKAIAAFHEKCSSLQATAKSTSIHSQSLSQSRASEKGSGLRISEIIDLTLESNEDCTEIGVGNANENPSSSVNYFMSHDVAQSTTTTSPLWDIQDFDDLSITQGMGEKQAFNGSGMIDPELAVQYAETQMEIANSNLQILFSTPASHSTPQEISLRKISSSEAVPGSTKSRKRGDPHQCNCTTCKKYFSRRKDCLRHELLHTNAKKFHCRIEISDEASAVGEYIHFGCGRRFTRLDALRAHWNSLRGADCLKVIFEQSKRRLLDQFRLAQYCRCGSEFETVDDLKTHLGVPLQTSCLRQEIIEAGVIFMLDDYSEWDLGQE